MKKIFTSEDKARIALLAYQGLKQPAAIGSAYQAHPIQIGMWKQKLVKEAHTIFDTEKSDTKRLQTLTEEIDELHRIIGVRDAELVWLKKKSGP